MAARSRCGFLKRIAGTVGGLCWAVNPPFPKSVAHVAVLRPRRGGSAHWCSIESVVNWFQKGKINCPTE
jgi:hypothetical protein